MEQLLRAISLNKVETVRDLLEKGLEIDFVNAYGNDRLFDKISKIEKVEILKLILDYGGNQYINCNYSSNGGTMLHEAVKSVEPKNVELLLERGADANSRDKDNRTPLFDATYLGVFDTYSEELDVHSKVVDLLLEHGADINAIDNKNNNAMLEAVSANRAIHYCNEKIEKLFNCGCSADIVNNQGENVLMYCFAKDDDIYNYYNLIESASLETINSRDTSGKTALIHTIEYLTGKDKEDKDENELIVKFIGKMLKAGADINIADNEGKGVLSYLIDGYIKNNRDNIYPNIVLLKIANKLLKYGITIKDIDNIGIFGMDFIINMAAHGHKEALNYYKNNIKNYLNNINLGYALEVDCVKVAQILISKGIANLNEQNNEGITPLMIASIKGYKNIASLLLQGGANINTVDNHGYNALLYAMEKEKFEIAEYLIDCGAVLDVYDEAAQNIFLNSIVEGKFDTTNFLINHGVILDSDNEIIQGILLNAVERNHMDVARYLVNLGVRFNASDKRIEKILLNAILNNELETVQFLQENINNVQNINRESILKAIRIASIDFGDASVSPYHGVNIPMMEFIKFGVSINGFDLTQEELNILDNVARRIDNAIVNENQEEVKDGINNLFGLCVNNRKFYDVIDTLMYNDIVRQDDSTSLTRLLNFHGFDTKEFNIKLKTVNTLKNLNVLNATMNDRTEMSIINKFFKVIFMYQMDENFDILSQNVNINNACLVYQRENTEENKQNLIDIIINNTNNEVKRSLLEDLEGVKIATDTRFRKFANLEAMINSMTDDNLGTCLKTRLQAELGVDNTIEAGNEMEEENEGELLNILNNILNVNNALNNNQNQRH